MSEIFRLEEKFTTYVSDNIDIADYLQRLHKYSKNALIIKKILIYYIVDINDKILYILQ